MWLLLACTPELDIQVSPPALDLGVVDFDVEMPDEGYPPSSVSFINQGTVSASLSLVDYDPDHLCVVGFTGRSLPITMGELAEGSVYVLEVGACGYAPGERDTEVQTELRVGTGGTPGVLVVPVVFTPTRTIGDDSG